MISSSMARKWADQQQSIGELFDGLPHEQTKEEQFQEFVRQNPIFVQRIIDRALQEKRAGMVRGGMKKYFEDLRNSSLSSDGKYRLNNNYTSLMARYVMDKVPELRGFFELRELAGGPMKRVYDRR